MLNAKFNLSRVWLEAGEQQFTSFHNQDLVFNFALALHDFHNCCVDCKSPVVFYFRLDLLAICFLYNFAD